MHLITMAHAGEAQGVINAFKLIKKSQDLFSNDEIVLLITGEGPFEAATKTALTVSMFPFQEIINLGFAGTLNQSLEIGQVYPVRTLYLVQERRPHFKTFQSFSEGIDCLTCFERILDPLKAESLRGMGHLVDREAWGVAMAAKTAGIPFKSFKIISDAAGGADACELVKERALELSIPLAEKLQSYLGKEVTPPTELIHLKGFYFTFTTQHRFQILLEKISIKDSISLEAAVASLPTDLFLDQDILPKVRAGLLIEWMENKLDPTKKFLFDQKNALHKSFQNQGIRIQTDPLWEKSQATISFEAGSDLELNEKIAALKNLSLSSFEKLMNGDFNVE